MERIGHFDSRIAPKDSVERYMTAYERTLATQRMQEALLLVNLVNRVTGRLRRIPGTVREVLATARAQRENCGRAGAANFS